MNRSLINTLVIISVLGVTACSKASNEHTAKAEDKPQSVKVELSASDKKILNKYDRAVHEVIMTADEKEFKKALTPLIPELKQVTAKKQRELALMNVYMLTGMDKEAYELNEQQLLESPSPERAMFRCTMLEKLKESKVKIQQCHEVSAKLLQTALAQSANKNDPQYKDVEFLYLTEMYKAGHTDYKAKLQAFIDATKDVEAKDIYRSLYDEQIESFYGTDSVGYIPESLRKQ
ncbi:hypothetical protein [Acinetobacter pittii]|uniref:hypothetical protein n=1 Tax=Acinetobacter pittii TaxID=48296 RepID=UPI00396F2AD7